MKYIAGKLSVSFDMSSGFIIINIDYKRKNTPCIGFLLKCPIQGVHFILFHLKFLQVHLPLYHQGKVVRLRNHLILLHHLHY